MDGLPVVPEAKHEKLAGVLNKIYSQIGHVREGACCGGGVGSQWGGGAVVWGGGDAVWLSQGTACPSTLRASAGVALTG